ncbi:MAG: hypothetical protein ACE5GS_12810, partial [Kiloniellaceae bacterium]
MQSRKPVLLSTTMIPLVVVAGVAAGGVALTEGLRIGPALAQCAPRKRNPCAAATRSACAAGKRNPCAA